VHRLALLALLTTSCWRSTGETTAPEAPPVRVTEPSAAQRGLASQLADALRDPGDDMLLAPYLERQFVVLYHHFSTVEVLCDAQTLGAAIHFGALLNDPDRAAVECVAEPRDSITCTQAGAPYSLWLHFRGVDAPVLVGGILSNTPKLGPILVRNYRTKLGTSACPP